jgi:O-antigen/teichoic acid export membrane protein
MNILLNLCLIPFFSEKGAAVATTMTEMTVVILTLYHSRKLTRLPWIRNTITYILIFLLLLMTGALLRPVIPFYISIPVMLLIYLGILLYFRIFEMGTFRFIWRSLTEKSD